MALTTRKPTGIPAWPLMLLAGMQKAGKTYAAAQASASEFVGRTLWLPFGEDDPDEYGALPGTRFEIVEHDGTFLDFRRALREAVAEPPAGGPTLLVVDSLGRVWDFLQAQAQLEANERARRRQKDVSGEEIPITSDLWNLAKSRWSTVMNPLRDHAGPVLALSRLEDVAVMGRDGAPTGERQWKVKAEKTLPGDVDVIVEMRSRSDVALTGLRSLKVDVAKGVNDRLPLKDFTVEGVWRMLGLLDGAKVGRRRYTPLDAERSAADSEAEAVRASTRRVDQRAARDELAAARGAAWEAAQRLGWDSEAAAMDWEATRGKPITEGTPEELAVYTRELHHLPARSAPRDPQMVQAVDVRKDALAAIVRRFGVLGVADDDRLPLLTGTLGRFVKSSEALTNEELVSLVEKLHKATPAEVEENLPGFRDLHALGAQMTIDEVNDTHNEGDAGNDGRQGDAEGDGAAVDGGAVAGVADVGAGEGDPGAAEAAGEGGAGDGAARDGAGRSKARAPRK